MSASIFSLGLIDCLVGKAILVRMPGWSAIGTFMGWHSEGPRENVVSFVVDTREGIEEPALRDLQGSGKDSGVLKLVFSNGDVLIGDRRIIFGLPHQTQGSD